MPVRNGVLGRGVIPAAGGNLAFGPVAATDTWIVKSAIFYNAGGAAANVSLQVIPTGGGISAVFVLQSLAAGASLYWGGWVAAGPQDTVQAGANMGPIHVHVSGADLPGHL